MKKYLNSADFFRNHLSPKKEAPLTWNNFTTGNQSKLIAYVDQLPGISVESENTQEELEIIQQINSEIDALKKQNHSTKPDRLDMDLAIIFHRNLKKLKWGRFQIDDFGTWRWMSLNFFLNQVRWRWNNEDPKNEKLFENAKSCYQRLVGERNRRIFPLWYFTIGERLYDNHFGYSLLEKLAQKAKEHKSGGFGNLNNYLNDTKLLSPNEHVSKTMSRILLSGTLLASNDEVEDSFKRYNAYKRRLLNYASDTIFEKEICIMKSRKIA